MLTTKPSLHTPLTSKQEKVLDMLYKFRFLTAQLLTDKLHAANKRVVAGRLQVLERDGYIGKYYDGSFRLAGKPAVYYLLPKSRAYFNTTEYCSQKVLHSLYKDKYTEERIYSHYLHVFEVYNRLNQQYPDIFDFYSQTELRESWHLLTPRPDAHLRRKRPRKTMSNDYFLMTIETGNVWTHRRKVRSLIEYFEKETWKTRVGRPEPVILFVCESQGLVRHMNQIIEKEMDMTWVDLRYIVTTDEDISNL